MLEEAAKAFLRVKPFHGAGSQRGPDLFSGGFVMLRFLAGFATALVVESRPFGKLFFSGENFLESVYQSDDRRDETSSEKWL